MNPAVKHEFWTDVSKSYVDLREEDGGSEESRVEEVSCTLNRNQGEFQFSQLFVVQNHNEAVQIEYWWRKRNKYKLETQKTFFKIANLLEKPTKFFFRSKQRGENDTLVIFKLPLKVGNFWDA